MGQSASMPATLLGVPSATSCTYTVSPTSIKASPHNNNQTDGRQRVSVKTACTIAIINTMSITGYRTVTARSIGAPLDDSITGVTTQCQMTADTEAATIAPSMAASRRNCAADTPYRPTAKQG